MGRETRLTGMFELHLRQFLLIAGLVLWGLLLFSAHPAVAAVGRVAGKVVDAKTGEPVVGATVMIQNSKSGGRCNIDGDFLIKNVPEGTHTLIISSIGYVATEITELKIRPGDVVRVDVALEQKVLENQKTVTVTAKRVQGTDAALLAERQQAVVVSDAISARTIARAGSSDAADAMKRVTGASVVGGKYVFIRGLGDRYTNVQLNGSLLPSPDPDRQAVPLDLIPANLLDNITVTKSFSADKPGSFSGGSINLVTKSFPDSRSLQFSTGSSYNSLATFENVLTYQGSSKDWLGYDDGSRDMGILETSGNMEMVPKGGSPFFTNAEIAHFVDDAAKSINRSYEPNRRPGPLNQNYLISYGDNVQLFGRQLGLVGSLSYNRKLSFYEDGRRDTWVSPVSINGKQLMEPYDLFSDSRAADEVLWGGLTTLSYSPGQNHTVSASYVANRGGESETRWISGHSLERADSSIVFRSRVLRYTERSLDNIQLQGRHEIQVAAPVRINWQLSSAMVGQDEPDLRLFSDNYYINTENDPPDTLYAFGTGSGFGPPSRFWRTIDERNREIKLDLSLPVDRVFKISGGVDYLRKTRSHRQFQLNLYGDPTRYDGDFDSYMSQTGIRDSVRISDSVYRYSMNSYWTNATYGRDQYDGRQTIAAWYAMVDMHLPAGWDLIAGIRHETTDMSSVNQDKTPLRSSLTGDDWLPSINLIHRLGSDMNIRAAYGRTLARPSLREISPFASEEFAGSRFYHGNPDLTYTTIRNYDLRWEWFIKPDGLVAVSAFYKRFENPIEVAMFGGNYDRRPVNADKAMNIGAELELRAQLKPVWHELKNLSLGLNLTLVSSNVRIPADELALMRRGDPDIKDTRPMANQSPYLINIDLGYMHPRLGTTVDLLYNAFGRRFSYNAPAATPDVYENPRHLVDLTMSQKLWRGMSIKFAAKNLLDDDYETVYWKPGTKEEWTYQKYDLGRSYSLGITYSVL